MFGLGGGELLLLGIIALVFIGPKKLPELAKGLGKGIREFQKAKNELLNEVDEEVDNRNTSTSSASLSSSEHIEAEKVDDVKSKETLVSSSEKSEKNEATSKEASTKKS